MANINKRLLVGAPEAARGGRGPAREGGGVAAEDGPDGLAGIWPAFLEAQVLSLCLSHSLSLSHSLP